MNKYQLSLFYNEHIYIMADFFFLEHGMIKFANMFEGEQEDVAMFPVDKFCGVVKVVNLVN